MYSIFIIKEGIFLIIKQIHKIRIILLRIKRGLQKETVETKAMISIYYKNLKKEASKDEIEYANKQFIQFLKTMGLGFFIVLPFSGLTLPFFVKLAKIFGIDLIPDSFKE